jgi:hypothetical protein
MSAEEQALIVSALNILIEKTAQLDQESKPEL